MKTWAALHEPCWIVLCRTHIVPVHTALHRCRCWASRQTHAGRGLGDRLRWGPKGVWRTVAEGRTPRSSTSALLYYRQRRCKSDLEMRVVLGTQQRRKAIWLLWTGLAGKEAEPGEPERCSCLESRGQDPGWNQGSPAAPPGRWLLVAAGPRRAPWGPAAPVRPVKYGVP